MNISTLVSTIVTPVFDSVFKWKSQSDKMEITRKEFDLLKQETEANIRLKLMEEMRKPRSEFRDFMLKYEGGAEQQPAWMRAFRSSVRPVITYWSLIIITLIMFGFVGGTEVRENLQAIPEPLWQIFLAIFGFWFGGRALMQVADTWKAGEVKKQEAAAAARPTGRPGRAYGDGGAFGRSNAGRPPVAPTGMAQAGPAADREGKIPPPSQRPRR